MSKRKSVSSINRQRATATDSQAEGYFSTPQTPARASSARITSVQISEITPDRFQPRLILPPDLKDKFFGGELDVYQVAELWLQRGEDDSAEQARIAQLLLMAETIQSDGQIKPATGYYVGEGLNQRIRLETGERRFWSLALRSVSEMNTGLDSEEPSLEIRIIQEPSRARQVIENNHAETPSAVSRAREIASIVLESLEIMPEEFQNDYDYYYQVVKIKRIPPQVWDEVMKYIPLKREMMKRMLNVLKLPLDLLLIADKYNIPERRLRELAGFPARMQMDMLQKIIKDGASSADLQALRSEAMADRPKKEPATNSFKAASRIRSFLGFVEKKKLEGGLGEVASELSVRLENPERIRYLAGALEELANKLRTRAGGLE